jgi:predicted esterase
MKANFRTKRLASLVVAIAIGVFVGLAVWRAPIPTSRWLWQFRGKLMDHPTYLIYLPDNYRHQEQYPLVFALSPSADAFAMISTWSSVADKHHWIVAASKETHNGEEWDLVLQQVETELEDVERNYKIEPEHVIFTGISGGGMVAHAVSKFYPDQVNAIIINTGMMEETFMTDDYPEKKLAVFLSSPTDFRYQEMQRDQNFLMAHHWQTKWIEFSGGHTMAPVTVYEEAVEWLEDNLSK